MMSLVQFFIFANIFVGLNYLCLCGLIINLGPLALNTLWSIQFVYDFVQQLTVSY